jgi:hypothetical protein
MAGILGGVVLGIAADRVRRVKALLLFLYFAGTCLNTPLSFIASRCSQSLFALPQYRLYGSRY